MSGKIHLTGVHADPEPEAPKVSADVNLYIDSDRFRPIPKAHQIDNCASCQRRNAGWMFLPTNEGPDPDPKPICSLCWLYVSMWARPRQEKLVGFIERVEHVLNKTYRRDGGGLLVDHREADDVVERLLRASILYAQSMADPKVARG